MPPAPSLRVHHAPVAACLLLLLVASCERIDRSFHEPRDAVQTRQDAGFATPTANDATDACSPHPVRASDAGVPFDEDVVCAQLGDPVVVRDGARVTLSDEVADRDGGPPTWLLSVTIPAELGAVLADDTTVTLRSASGAVVARIDTWQRTEAGLRGRVALPFQELRGIILEATVHVPVGCQGGQRAWVTSTLLELCAADFGRGVWVGSGDSCPVCSANTAPP